MKAILKQPGQRPAAVEMENTLQALQKAVGGYIETVRITSDACLICNEKGRLMGLEPNPCGSSKNASEWRNCKGTL